MTTMQLQERIRLVPRKLRKTFARPPVGKFQWGDFNRVKPASRRWGFDRGTPVDRYFILQFLKRNRNIVRGTCLEIGNDRYTSLISDGKAERIEILHYTDDNPEATIVGDLVDAPHIESNQFDCIICTQTLQFVTSPADAIRTMVRLLKPGGTLLLSVPCLSQLDLDPENSWDDRWRFTTAGVGELFSPLESETDTLEINAVGNVKTASAFLHGLAVEEIDPEALEKKDSMFELIVFAKFQKRLAAPDSKQSPTKETDA